MRFHNKRHKKMFFIRMRNFEIQLIFYITIIIQLISVTPSDGAIKYETAYACDGKVLTLECQPGDLINLIRANYGRFSLTICNDNGNVDWSVNCMSSQQSLRVLTEHCGHKQTCNVLASSHQFKVDPCPGTYKYLEAHYQCISAAQTLRTTTVKTTTTRPSPPPWLLAQQPPNATPAIKQTPRLPSGDGTEKIHLGAQKPPPVPSASSSTTTTASKTNNSSSGIYGISGINLINQSSDIISGYGGGFVGSGFVNQFSTEKSTTNNNVGHQTTQNNLDAINKNNQNQNFNTFPTDSTTTQIIVGSNNNNGGGIVATNDLGYCTSTTSRNLFWNITRMGESNVQPCPDGTTGIAKWRCIPTQVKMAQDTFNQLSKVQLTTDMQQQSLLQQSQQQHIQLIPAWHPQTPDLTQCRSLWLNTLELSSNEHESSLMSIANDLSQVTSSKTLYGGDLLLTTKIIQTMSDRMSHDIGTYPDQRMREAILNELLTSVVKISSNLLHDSHPWLDLSFEDQMRIATALLTGLENNAFLLADCITRDKRQIQKSKNILLSVHVLEAKNILASEEIFPDPKHDEFWDISDDRIELPKVALLENADGGLVRIVFIAFDRLETILKPSNLDLKPTKSQDQDESQKILNSKIISASLGKGRHIQLSQPIKLTLKHLVTVNVSNPSCVYWNLIDHGWSTDGCHLETSNRTHSICVCNHLTNFAILMDVVDTTHQHESLFTVFPARNLRIFIYISTALCIIFILVALITVKSFEGNGSSRNSIYKNIYICLFIAECLFLLGIEQTETNLLCGFTTAFLHCFTLSAIAWICFESLQLYFTIRRNDDIGNESTSNSKPILYYLFTYGLSFTVVAIALAIDPSIYTQSDFCVLMASNLIFYIAFLLPILVFLCGAILSAILVCVVICKKYSAAAAASKSKEHAKLSTVRFDMQCSFVFLMLLFSDWIFCYLYLRRAKEIESIALTYGYAFVTFNSLLGIYIFIFHCAQNEKIRREYQKYLRQNLWLPNCLRESKTTVQQQQTSTPQQHYGTQKKNAILVASNSADIIADMQIGGGTSGIVAGTPTSRKYQPNFNDGGGANTLQRGHIILERGQISGIQGGTLRRQQADHSPTSSIDSTNLMLNQAENNWSYTAQQQQQQQQQSKLQTDLDFNYPNENNKNFNSNYDDKFLYYDCKSNRISFSNDFHQQSPAHRHKNGDLLVRSNEFGSSSCSSGSNYNNRRDEPIYEEIPNSHLDDEYARRYHHHLQTQQRLQQQHQQQQNFIDDFHHYQMQQQMKNPSGSLASRKSNKNTNRKTNKKRLNEESGFSGQLVQHHTIQQQQQLQQQQQQQQLQQQQQQQLQQQSTQIVGRNLSAMLDENNTVVCYLEP